MTLNPGNFDALLPGYPAALFDLLSRGLQLPHSPRVVDIGAGTGRASLAMARLGWQVTALEPDAPTLDVLRERASAEGLQVATVEATAERTGLRSASVDLATAAHAFHWFNKRLALEEIVRVTRPGGGVALFWNVRDRSRSAFIAAHRRVLDRHGMPKRLYLEAERASGRATRDALAREVGLAPARLIHLEHEMAMRPDEFITLGLLPGWVRALPRTRQEAYRADLVELLADHGYIGEALVTIPYRIDCWIATRRPDGEGTR